MIATGNLFSGINAERLDGEVVMPLLELPGLRIERIVSTGQASPPDFWYDQPETEWVVLLKGEAGLLLQGEDVPRVLKPGDWITLPPHCRHRVEWSAADRETVWLAVHHEGR